MSKRFMRNTVHLARYPKERLENLICNKYVRIKPNNVLNHNHTNPFKNNNTSNLTHTTRNPNNRKYKYSC